ncbi:MAG: acyltransferase [Pseudomonadota bacterium]
MSGSDRLTWVDALRLTAGLSMVGLHATADPSGQPWADYVVGERIGPVLLRAVLYVARTELFIIISVFLLLLALDRRPRSYPTVMKQQASRLLVPFAFWTVFYAAYGLIKAAHFGYLDAAQGDLFNPISWVGYLLLGDVKYHMHFIPTLFGVLLFFPLYVKAMKFPILGVGVLVGLIIKAELDAFIYPNLWGTDVLPYAVRGAKILTYVGYGMVAGAALGLLKRTGAKTLEQWFAPLLYLGGMLFIIKLIGSYKTIISGSYPFDYTAGYWADFLMPVLLFLCCMSLSMRDWPKILTTLAPYSFGLYLCHPIFLDIAEVVLQGRDLTPMAQVSLKIAFIVPSTSIFIYFLKRCAPLAWTIGLGPLPVIPRVWQRESETS